MQLGSHPTNETGPEGALRALIVGGDAGLTAAIRQPLEDTGFTVDAAADAGRGLAQAQAELPHVVLLPARLPTMDAVEFLQRFREAGRAGLVIVLAGHGTDDAELAAMREGAYGVLPVPIRPDELRLVARRAAEHEQLRREVQTLRESLGAHMLNGEIVAESAAMRAALDMAATLAAHDAPVLITGETGTGKEVLARAIHRMSCRKHAPVIGVPCDAIPEQLLETEFFGDAPASASGRQPNRCIFVRAAGGTVLFEEITALPLRLQEHVLSAIDDRAAGRANGDFTRARDARVIGTSTKSLAAEVERGQFLDQLHQRLRAAHIKLPPLRERPEDIPGLLAHFAQQAAGSLGRPISLTPQALSLLTAYPWPGNVRELRHEVERAAALSPTGRLDRSDFGLTGPGRDGAGGGGNSEAGVGGPTLKLKPQVESFERNAIRRALAAASGNRREAAQLLGVSLRTLFYKLRRYGLE